jgi:thiol-disulfide isomerase/thioredoxin
MKKIALFLMGLLAAGQIISCSSSKKTAEQPQKIILDIQAKNLPEQKAYITDYKNKTYPLNKISDGHFADTLSLEKGYYKINIGKEYSNIFLKPGMSLHIDLDANQFDETIHYQGSGAKENNLLAAEMLDNEKVQAKYNPKKIAKLSENDFLKIADSIYQSKLDKLNKSEVKDKDFVQWQTKKYLIEKNMLTLNYPRYKKYFTQKPYQPSDQYPSPLQGLDINDPQLIKIPGFLGLVELSIPAETPEEALKDDYMLALMQTAEKKLKSNPELKEIIIARVAEFGINRTKHLEEFYQIFSRNVKDENTKQKIEKIYNNLKELQPGKPSPDFTAYDINGKEYHLSDFKGKNVYIDLWATWCAPCRMEIPYLEKLKKEYKDKNIEFVSIDVFDDKNKWENMVKSGKISGVQLIIPDRNSKFLELYNVRGIPRFIFIDKEGNIIDNNVSRPSNPATKELINKYVTE